MLNGIGGNTIASAKNNLTQEEFMFWSAYRNMRGSLNVGRRVEQANGSLIATYLCSKGAKDVKALSFMPHEDQSKQMSLEELMMAQYGGG